MRVLAHGARTLHLSIVTMLVQLSQGCMEGVDSLREHASMVPATMPMCKTQVIWNMYKAVLGLEIRTGLCPAQIIKWLWSQISTHFATHSTSAERHNLADFWAWALEGQIQALASSLSSCSAVEVQEARSACAQSWDQAMYRRAQLQAFYQTDTAQSLPDSVVNCISELTAS